jgi:hypothetical protein
VALFLAAAFIIRVAEDGASVISAGAFNSYRSYFAVWQRLPRKSDWASAIPFAEYSGTRQSSGIKHFFEL